MKYKNIQHCAMCRDALQAAYSNGVNGLRFTSADDSSKLLAALTKMLSALEDVKNVYAGESVPVNELAEEPK